MVITQAQFNKAMEEINSSYSALLQRVQELEEKVNEKERPQASASGSKRVQQTKANSEPSN